MRLARPVSVKTAAERTKLAGPTSLGRSKGPGEDGPVAGSDCCEGGLTKTPDLPAVSPNVMYGTSSVDGLNIAYREAGDPTHPQLVLLHGFPSSSHHYRNLIPVLSDRFHVIAPDYPGFGNSDQPDPAKFSYTFDELAQVTEKFLKAKGFDRFGLFMQDYGRSGRFPHHRPPSRVGAVAHDPEHQCL